MSRKFNLNAMGKHDAQVPIISRATGRRIAQYRYSYYPDGSVDVLFRNDLTGVEQTRHYKTQSAAQGQITRFVRRIARVYAE